MSVYNEVGDAIGAPTALASSYWLARRGIPAYLRSLAVAGSLAGGPLTAGALAGSEVMAPVPANSGEVPQYVKQGGQYVPNPSLGGRNPLTSASAPLPMPTPSTDMASAMLPFGPYGGRTAPIIPSSFQPTAASAPAAAQPDVQTYNFDELNPMDPFAPLGARAAPGAPVAGTGSIPMPRPRPNTAPAALMPSPTSGDPRLANMADPSLLNLGGPLQARTVSDGEGGFMNDYYSKKLFGLF
jgi:hypothetical protein